MSIASTALLRLFNVPGFWRWMQQHRAARSVWDPADDLELKLYDSILGNGYLHYGYFEDAAVDPDTISLARMRQAMDDYATLLVSRVRPGEHVLDIGCGSGGLLKRLHAAGALATGLTPNTAHHRHIHTQQPNTPLLHSTLEALDTSALPHRFDVAINAESFQYIKLDQGMQAVRKLLEANNAASRWIVIDYFRLREDTRNKSGHMLSAFESAIKRYGFEVSERLDVTENVLPTLAYARSLVERLALPLGRFGSDKFFLKHRVLAYLFQDCVKEKIARIRLDTLDPAVFRRDKRYVLFTLVPR